MSGRIIRMAGDGGRDMRDGRKTVKGQDERSRHDAMGNM
jgi:hypothetical protein